MNSDEFIVYLKTIKDRGFLTALEVSGYGDLALKAITFDEELRAKGFCLTTYYGTNFSRCWGIYDKNEVRPQRVRNCILHGDQYFRPERRKTKKCGGYISLVDLEKKFKHYLRKKQ